MIEIKSSCKLSLNEHRELSRDELNDHFVVALFTHPPCPVCNINFSYYIINRCDSEENLVSQIRSYSRFFNSRLINMGEFNDLIYLTSEYHFPMKSIGRYLYSISYGDTHELYCFRKFMKEKLGKNRSMVNKARKMNKANFLKEVGNTDFYDQLYKLANIRDAYKIKKSILQFLDLNRIKANNQL